MDITEPSKSSNGATRKRRSSILKSQRPPRTPFSDLEFNVATPTETTTSRRVSFSRRTGVAEFVTNEATTTWKNVYEEQNKSLESSNNENEVKRQPLGHIGRRQIDDQFQLVNYAEHLASIDCIDNDRDLIAPQQNFELSCFTEHQNKLFSDNIVNPDIVEMTDHIDINFSFDQQNNASREIDDLDEIQKVILQPRSSDAMVFGPSKDGRFIELDLNTTHVTFGNEQSDMSITDTIHSSLVASISNPSLKINKSLNKKDWVADKENIVVNPYSAPPENVNFAINSDDDQVLVFDGRRLTRQGRSIDLLDDRAKSSPQNVAKKTQRNPLIITDDLPDFIDNTKLPYITSEIKNISANTEKLKNTILYDDSNDISITQAVGCVIETQMNKNKTVMYCDDDISLTVVASNNIISEKVISNKSKTVIYESDSADISVTQAVPTKVIEQNEKSVICDNVESMKQASSNKCTTIVFENEDCDISVTQAAISSNVFQEELKKNRDTVSQNDAEHISVTQALSSNLIISDNIHDKCDSVIINRQSDINIGHNAEEDEKRTIVYQDDEDDVALPRALLPNLIICENTLDKSRTVINNRQSDISITSAVASNLIACNNAEGNMSMTQALPINILGSTLNITQTEQNPNEQLIMLHKSMQDKTSSLSFTQMIRNNILESNSDQFSSERRKTILFNNEMGDISLTQAISGHVLVDEVQQNHMLLSQDVDISITEAMPKNIQNTEENTTIIPDKSIDHDMSITQAVLHSNREKKITKNITIAYENDTQNMSMTKPIPDAFLNVGDKQFEDKVDKYCDDDVMQHQCPANNDIIVYQTATAIDTDTPLEDSTHNVKCDITNKLELSNHSIQNVLEKSSCTLQRDVIQNIKTAALRTENHNISLNRQSTSPDLSITNSLTLDLPPSAIQPKNSIINDLLDMSNASLVDGFENKNVMAIDKQENSEKFKSMHSDTSINSIFYIIKDCDKIAEINDSNTSHISSAVNIPKAIKQNRKKSIQLINDDVTQDHTSEPDIEFEAKQSHVVKSLQKKFNKIKHLLLPDKKNNFIENKLDLNAKTENEVDNERVSQKNSSLEIYSCDNTKDLLDLISDLSETRRVQSPTRNLQEGLPINNSRLMGFDNKSESCAPLNLACVAQGQSIVLSGEDLINNISMAQADAQESQMDIDENLNLDDTANTVSTETKIASKKTVRLSSNVVKALQFEDESVSEMSMKSLDKYISPIRKTVFGETSYMNESKAKVIPSYMEDVAKNIKALMNDLVKPMADVLPYKAFEESKSPCKCDNQIQADIITSSQIDLDGALQYTPPHEIDKAEILVTNDIADKDSTCSILHHKLADENNEMELDESNLNANKQETNSDGVLCFDPHNPLNNVLIAPIDSCIAHKYNPMHSTDSELLLEHSELSSSSLRKAILRNPEYDAEIGLVSTYFNQNDKYSDSFNASDCEMVADSKSISKLSKHMSIDRAIDVRAAELKHIDCNTMIAMKSNKDLLDASSSLTLVDDALNQKPDENIAVCDEIASTEALMETDNEKNETKDAQKKVKKIKPKKRIYSPSFKRDLTQTEISLNTDITPKPASKILKRSGNVDKNQTEYNNNPPQAVQVKPGPIPEIKLPVEDVMKKSPTKEKISPKKINKQSTNDKKPVTSVTVQHLMTEFQMNDKIDEKKLNKSILKMINDEVSKTQIKSEEVLVARENSMFGSVNSFTSSNNQMPTLSSEERFETVMAQSISNESNSVWEKESRSEAPSSKFYAEFEPSVNIVAKINMLPFMGDTSECEWESSSGDTWSFLLLFGRIRLTVRLAHRLQNALRSSVRADTPLTHVALDIVPLDIKNPVGVVCVPYALEAMRVQLADVCVAAQVPALLRRCAAVTRLATRWARAMHDARLHLAYKLDPDQLVLKVANVRLRCVWEVSMGIEMVESEERWEAFPCVRHVVARSVLEGRAAPGERDAAALRALVQRGPLDWGHVPRTLWEVYEYLKNKTREDDLEFGLM